MTTIYLPVEVSARELPSKVFLATRLASAGHKCVLFRSDIFDLAGWPVPGIYIGKNCFRTEVPYSLHYYEKMKRRGLRVWYLDEEGGVYAGQSESDWVSRLRKRLDPRSLAADDKILTWGEWQADAFREGNPHAPVTVTGSPNYDIVQAKYATAFAEYDEEITKGLKDFVLVNTRFSASNGLIDIAGHLSDASPASQLISRRDLAQGIVGSGLLQYEFVRLVYELAEAAPSKLIVLRPHPAERIDFYRTLLGPLPNVRVHATADVGPWIRRCAVLVHNGCSTAIQADINGKPVITYSPVLQGVHSAMGLPDRVGVTARTPTEVLSLLASPPSTSSKPWAHSISVLDSIDRIADLVDLESRSSSPAHWGDNIRIKRSVLRFEAMDTMKCIPRHLISARRDAHERSQRAFDATFFSRASKLHCAANKHYASTTSIHGVGRNSYLITPATELSD